MRRRELEDKIDEAFRARQPRLRDSIIEACKGEAQLPKAQLPEKEKAPSLIERLSGFFSPRMGRRVAAFAVCLVMVVGAAIGFSAYFGRGSEGDGAPAVATVTTTVYLDVNPSVMIELDGDDKIIKCSAVNSDAAAVIESLELSGKDIRAGLDEILGAMYDHEYLSAESNSVLVSVDTADDRAEKLLADLSSKASHALDSRGFECSVIAQSVKADEQTKKQAEERGVSVGKMHLVNKMVDGMDDYTDDDKDELFNMSIKELNLIYENREPGDGDDHFKDDISSGSVGGYVKDEDRLDYILADLGIIGEQGYKLHVKVGWDKTAEGQRRMVYILSIRLDQELPTYTCKIDCLTGEIISIDRSSEPDGLDVKLPEGEGDPDGDGRDADGHDEEQAPPADGTHPGCGAPDEDETDGEEPGLGDHHGGAMPRVTAVA